MDKWPTKTEVQKAIDKLSCGDSHKKGYVAAKDLILWIAKQYVSGVFILPACTIKEG